MTLARIEAGVSGSKGMELHRGRLSIAPERCIVGFSGCQFIVDGHFHFEDLRAADPDKAVQLSLNVNCVSKVIPTSYNVKKLCCNPLLFVSHLSHVHIDKLNLGNIKMFQSEACEDITSKTKVVRRARLCCNCVCVCVCLHVFTCVCWCVTVLLCVSDSLRFSVCNNRIPVSALHTLQ